MQESELEVSRFSDKKEQEVVFINYCLVGLSINCLLGIVLGFGKIKMSKIVF